MTYLSLNFLCVLWFSLFQVKAGILPVALPHASNQSLDPNKDLVIVYYSNETDADGEYLQNINQLSNFLKKQNDPYAQKYLEWLSDDLKSFRAHVEKQQKDLIFVLSKISKQQKQGGRVHAIFFSNSLAKQDQYLVYTSGSEKPQLKSWRWQPPNNNIFTNSNPLSHTKSLKQALQTTVSEFSSKLNQFVLVTKSHGDELHALRPKVLLYLDRLNKGDLNKSYQAWRSKIARDFAFLKNSIDQKGKLGESRQGESRQGEKKESSGMAVLEELYSSKMNYLDYTVSKESWISIVSDYSTKMNMDFVMVFLDACQSFLSEEQLLKLSKVSVKNIYSSDFAGLDYDHIDYRKSLINTKNKVEFFSRLTSAF